MQGFIRVSPAYTPFSQGYTFVIIVSLSSFEFRCIPIQYMYAVSDVSVSAEEVESHRHPYTWIFTSFIQCLNDVKRWGQGKDLVTLAAGILVFFHR